MDITVKMIKELEDGSAIVSIEMDKDAKEYLIGEGFLVVIERALKSSEVVIKEGMLEGIEVTPKKKRKSK
jgi:hypothetical protein